MSETISERLHRLANDIKFGAGLGEARFHQACLLRAIADVEVAALERRSITEAVPEGWELAQIRWVTGDDGHTAYKAILCEARGYGEASGTGPTPEAAVADAVEKIP